MVFNIFIITKYIANFVNNLLIRYPLPKNIGYMWNYGSLSGIFLVIQLITGIFLSMFYTPHVDYAFSSVDNIMHNIMYGWMIRLVHLNSASFFFLVVYIHMLRNIYYNSYKYPRTSTWITGVTIYLLLMGAAFLGYVLPWGQMSYWAATVITNLLSVAPIIGHDLVHCIWGGFSINNATLNRFFCLHYLLPFIICIFLFLHLIVLHKTGSSNETKLKISINYNVKFYPYFIVKDLFTICLYFLFFSFFVFFKPEFLNHSINYIKSNPLVTPVHIVPEWYFLPFYTILRSILQKEIGVIYMFCSILILYLLPKIDLKNNRLIIHDTTYKKCFWMFFFNFLFLGYLGSQEIVYPVIELSLLCTWYHFYYFLFILPILLQVNTFYYNIDYLYVPFDIWFYFLEKHKKAIHDRESN